MTRVPARLAAFALIAVAAAGCSSGEHSARDHAAGDHATVSSGPATLALTSADVADGRVLPPAQMGPSHGGSSTSPELAWSGAPPTTESFAVTVFDRDAGGGRGYWHWAVIDLPVTVDELPSGAGDPGGKLLPPGARQLPGSSGVAGYFGAAPPAGSGTHHYVISVSALDVPTLSLPSSANAADVGRMIMAHTVARGELVPIATG